MTAIQKQITVTDVAFDQLDDRAMTAKATLRIGNVTYSYLTIDAVLSDDLRIKSPTRLSTKTCRVAASNMRSAKPMNARAASACATAASTAAPIRSMSSTITT
jgi:hypothetical protein